MKEARKKRKEKKTLFLTGVPRPADEAGRLGAGLEQPLQSLPDLVHDGEEGRVHVAEERERWCGLVVWGGLERKGMESVREEEEVERERKKKKKRRRRMTFNCFPSFPSLSRGSFSRSVQEHGF